LENKEVDPMDEVKSPTWKLIVSFIIILGFTLTYTFIWSILLSAN